MSKSNFKGSLLATTVIAGMALAAPAYAQSNPAEDAAPATDELPAAGTTSSEAAAPAEPTSSEEIVVTGTLIRNPNLVASAPVNVIGQEEMQLRATNVAEEVLRTIPGASANIGSNVNNGNGGAALVSLRGLGSARNLVLLDGVRLVPVGFTSAVDTNNIPLALVDRVDSLTGGSSTTYGADAVTGVVNFITRSDFAGMELQVSDQITERGDGHYLRGDLSIGANFDDGRGNAVISVGYQESDPVFQGGDRPLSQLAPNSFIADQSLPLGAVLTGSPTATPSTLEGLLPALPGAPLVPVAAGTPTSDTSAQVSLDGLTFATPEFQAFNFAPYNLFQTPFKRHNLFAAGHYDISDSITAYARGLFSKNVVNTIIAPSGVFNSQVRAPLSNPFLTEQQAAVLCARADFDFVTPGVQPLGSAADCAPGGALITAARAAATPTSPGFALAQFGLRRRTTEIGGRESEFQSTVFDFRAGARGDITNEIGWDAFVSRGQSERRQTQLNYTLISRARAALLATNEDTCLGPALGITTAPGTSGAAGCVPVNFFGGPGTLTPAGIDFLTDDSTTLTKTRLSQARVTINGDTPVQLWSDQPISFAVGGEYRKYFATFAADALSQSGDLGGAGGAAPSTEGAYDVYEGFGEVIAPLISDRPFMQELQLEAGIRRSHYTVDTPGQPKFNTTTWKVAGAWAPVRDIKVRGNYNRAVRAPNIGELFAPVNTILTNLGTDPCQGAAPLGSPALAAICTAQGGGPFLGAIPAPDAGQINITVGGNPALKPEKANTWTVGAVVRPSFIPGFDATIDYYNIKITEMVSAPTPGDLIGACFGPTPLSPPAGAAASPACTSIIRNPSTGGLSGDPTVPGLAGGLSNLGKAETDGVDLVLNYRRSLGELIGSPARIALNFSGNWTRKHKFMATPTDINRECVGFYSVNCGFTGSLNPEYSFAQRSTLSLGKVDFSVLWRYLHKMRYEPITLQAELDAAAAANAPATADPCPDFTGVDPNGCVLDPEFRRIGSRHYFDFTTRFNVNENFDLTLTVQNLLDSDPPSVGSTTGSTTYNSGNTYPASYDALGRRFGAAARIKF